MDKMVNKQKTKKLRKLFLSILLRLEGDGPSGYNRLLAEATFFVDQLKSEDAKLYLGAADLKLKELEERQANAHRGGQCPCEPEECDTFTARREDVDKQCLESKPGGMDVMDCCIREIERLTKSIPDKFGFRADDLATLKQRVADTMAEATTLLDNLKEHAGDGELTDEDDWSVSRLVAASTYFDDDHDNTKHPGAEGKTSGKKRKGPP